METPDELDETAKTGAEMAERKLSLAHRMVMLNHVQDKLSRNRKVLNLYRTSGMNQALGLASTPTPDSQEGENMLVLGDVVTHTTINQPAEEVSPAAAAVPDKKRTGLWTTLAAAAGLLLGGGTVGGIASAMFGKGEQLPATPQQPSVEQTFTDTNTVPSVIIRRAESE